jgi:hypothetical protein
MANSLLRKKQLKPSLFFNNAETSFVEYLYSGVNLTDMIIWTDNTKVQKIFEENYTYVSSRVNTVTTKQYDRTGVLIETLTTSLTYSGSKLISEDRVLT